MHITQSGDEAFEDILFPLDRLTESDANELVFALLDHLDLEGLRTNRTKHGNTVIKVRPRAT